MHNIIERCKQNDTAAFGELFETYNTQVYQSILVLVRNRTVAEDITQETFIHLFSKINQYNESYPFRNWLYQVALNLAKNHIRKHQGWNAWLKSKTFFNFNSKGDYTPEVALHQKELQNYIITHIKMLSTSTQMVITLKYFNEFKQEEISKILKIPIGTVKWHIHHGLKKLKNSIEKEHAEYREGFIHE